MTTETLRALVIGCGRIGAFWDKPRDALALTHAHAYRRHRNIGSIGFVDKDPESARRAAALWGGAAYGDLETALSREKPHIASVCTPDGAHFPALSRLLESDVRLILAEKPLTTNLGEAEELVRRGRERGKIISVNYSRRFDASVAETRAALKRGDYGRVLNAVGCYAKGILHNGSHLIDLLRHLLGGVESMRVMASRPGHGEDDPTLDCWLRMRDCPSVHLVGLDEESYSIHELDLFCERGRLRFTRFGFTLETQTVAVDPLFPGYRELSLPRIRNTGLTGAMDRYLEDGLRVLNGGEPLCPAWDAAVTLKVCRELLESYRKEAAGG